MSAMPPEKYVFQLRRCHMGIRLITSKKAASAEFRRVRME